MGKVAHAHFAFSPTPEWTCILVSLWEHGERGKMWGKHWQAYPFAPLHCSITSSITFAAGATGVGATTAEIHGSGHAAAKVSHVWLTWGVHKNVWKKFPRVPPVWILRCAAFWVAVRPCYLCFHDCTSMIMVVGSQAEAATQTRKLKGADLPVWEDKRLTFDFQTSRGLNESSEWLQYASKEIMLLIVSQILVF